MLNGTTPDWSQLGDRAALEQVFERASMDLTIAFQPIISWSQRRVMGHEVLLRSRDPELPDPMSVLAVAEKLQRVEEIGRRVREQVARQVLRAPANLVFVNLHPQELLDEELYSFTAPLSQFARRVVLGISESMLPLGLLQLEKRVATLRAMGFRFALKNLRAGHAGMGPWVRLRPEFAFLDGPLVRGLPRNEQKQEHIRMLSSQLNRLGTQVIAAGIETLMERDAVIASAVDWLQGFAFSPPESDYHEPFVD
jgi:EAL domain-containing protein (putative c-di-GMP-specific phosphodiesterase class I)